MQALSRRFSAARRRTGAALRGVDPADLSRWCPPGSGVRPAEVVQRLRACTHPRLYAAQVSHGPVDVDDTVRHYLSHGAERALRACALFAPDWYAATLAERGAEVPSGPTELFFHWLTVGWSERIVPTPLFDADWFAHRHPALAAELQRSGRWSFEYYLVEGCYQPGWVPSPLGRHHPGGDPERDPATGDPLLMRELLHRAGDFDLARTSWLEEGQRAGLERLASLDSPRMRALIDAAVALDPAVRHTSATPFTTVPPYRTRRLYLAEQAEAVRRAVGVTHADVVVLASGRGGADAAADAERLGRELAGGGSWLVVATDGRDAAEEVEPAGAGSFDLWTYSAGLEPRQGLDLLLDLVRGLTPRRLVLLDSSAGREAAETYGRQLSALCDLDIQVGSDLVSHAAWTGRGRP